MKRALLALTGIAAAFALAGCIVVPPPTPDRDDDRDREPAGSSDIECGTDGVVLNEAGATYRLSGDCDSVTIEGQDISVAADAIGVLDIRGDRNEAEFSADLGSLVIAGNDNEVGANAIGQTSDSGDRNRVTGR